MHPLTTVHAVNATLRPRASASAPHSCDPMSMPTKTTDVSSASWVPVTPQSQWTSGPMKDRSIISIASAHGGTARAST